MEFVGGYWNFHVTNCQQYLKIKISVHIWFNLFEAWHKDVVKVALTLHYVVRCNLKDALQMERDCCQRWSISHRFKSQLDKISTFCRETKQIFLIWCSPLPSEWWYTFWGYKHCTLSQVASFMRRLISCSGKSPARRLVLSFLSAVLRRMEGWMSLSEETVWAALKNMEGCFFLPPSYKAVSFRRFGGGGWRDGRINVSVRGSCSANRQQRLHCLQAETRNLIWERCCNTDTERLCRNCLYRWNYECAASWMFFISCF